jgi:hypothetical protein
MKVDTPADEPSAARVLASSTAQDTQKQAVKVCPDGMLNVELCSKP